MASKLLALHSPPLISLSFTFSRQNFPTVSTSGCGSIAEDPRRWRDSKRNAQMSPLVFPKKYNPIRPVTVKSSLVFPIKSPQDQWGTWTALIATAAFGIWSEKTKIGKTLNGALVSTLVGFAASNLGIISCQAPAYSVVLNFLLPLAVPLLLFRADLRRVIQSTGPLLLAFLIGSVGTAIGTAVAFLMVPMDSLGWNSWKMAAVLMGRHIGGAVYYVAGSEAFGVSPSVLAAGLAADNVICAVYFTILFALASKIPSEASTSTNDESVADRGMNDPDPEPEPDNKPPVLLTAAALAVSFAICNAGIFLTKYFGTKGGSLPAITAVVVILATAFPKRFSRLAPAGETMAMILMQVFFTVVGASGNIWNVIDTAPSIFMFSLVQIAVHLAVILGLGKLFGINLKLLLIASNANIGGPATACGMAAAKGWSSLIVPGILAGTFGITIATSLGTAFGVIVLLYM